MKINSLSSTLLGVTILSLMAGSLAASPTARAGANNDAATWAVLASVETGQDYRPRECRKQQPQPIGDPRVSPIGGMAHQAAQGQAAPLPHHQRRDRCAAFMWWPLGIAAGAALVGGAIASGGGGSSPRTSPSPN